MQEWKAPALGGSSRCIPKPSFPFQHVFNSGTYQARLSMLASVGVQPPPVAYTNRLTPCHLWMSPLPGVSIIKRRRMYAVEDERRVVTFVIRHPDIAPTLHGPAGGQTCNCRPRQHRLELLPQSAPEIFLAVFAAAVVGLWLWILPTRPLVLRTPAGSLPLG